MSARRFHSVPDFGESVDDISDNISLGRLTQQQQQQLLHQMNLPQHEENTPLKRSQMNELIMDYLVHEGFKEAAERFREEAGIKPRMETNGMEDRFEIKHLIEEGQILRAQSLINQHYPELLDNRRDLNFRLQQQHLIELIRQQKISEVLAYVHNQLLVEELEDLSEMERTLTLLAYEKPDKSPYASLMDISHRLQLASELNDIILQVSTGNSEPSKPKLVTLLKLSFWTQNELEKKKIKFAKMTDMFRINQ